MAKKYRCKCDGCGGEFLGREIGDWCPYCHKWVVCFYQTYMREIFDGAGDRARAREIERR